MAKLRVPGPHEQLPETFGVVELGAIIAAIAAVGVLYYFSTVQSEPGESAAAVNATDAKAASGGTDEQTSKLQEALKEQRALSEELAELSREELASREWTDEDLRAAYRYGPRQATEIVCRKNRRAIAAGDYDPAMKLELEKTLDRRTEFGPWTCMTRIFLSDGLEDEDLGAEMEEFFTELENFEGNARIPISILDTFRETRRRPDSDRFYAWLRMCGANMEYQAGPACRRLLNQIAPKQGADALLMLETHWHEVGVRDGDMEIVVDFVGWLARNGQPHNWKVLETEELPDYDVDFRRGAFLFLCRFVQSPDDDVATHAARELATAARVGGRSYEENLLPRWRETCRLAFGGASEKRGDEAASLMAVWSGVEGKPPDYTMQRAVEAGTCTSQKGYPIWYCGSRSWAGEGKPNDVALADFFVETRYMEWLE